MTGVHCCGEADWASVLAAGPAILSMPVSPGIVNVAGYLARFLDDGGWIMWGAVPTDSIVPTSAERPWRELSDVWCKLVNAGCDAIQAAPPGARVARVRPRPARRRPSPTRRSRSSAS